MENNQWVLAVFGPVDSVLRKVKTFSVPLAFASVVISGYQWSSWSNKIDAILVSAGCTQKVNKHIPISTLKAVQE